MGPNEAHVSLVSVSTATHDKGSRLDKRALLRRAIARQARSEVEQKMMIDIFLKIEPEGCAALPSTHAEAAISKDWPA